MGFKPSCRLGEDTQACTDDLKICIQVTGHGQDQEKQKMYFYRGELDIPAYEKADNIVTQQVAALSVMTTAPDCPSTLFNWDKNKVSNLKLGLQIKKAKGGYIYLPVANKIEADIERDKKSQHKSNQLLAFIPLAVSDLPKHMGDYFTKAFPQADESHRRSHLNIPNKTSEVIYAPARQGYLYIFYNKKLWRELKIEQDTNGKNLYKDIDLKVHRTENGQGPFLTEQDLMKQTENLNYCPSLNTLIREAEGEVLDEIWVPYRLSNHNTHVQITYCEDQLSPERLNYIETQFKSAQTSLTNNPRANLQIVNAASKYAAVLTTYPEYFPYAKGLVYASSFGSLTMPFRIDFLPATRGRNETIEYKLFHPASYLLDITDQAITKKYNATKQVDQQCTAKQAPDNNITLSDFNNIKIDAFREFEVDAWQEILAHQTSPQGTPKETIWSAHQPTLTIDTLADYKKRFIIGIPLADPLYELHRRHMLLNIAQNTELFKCIAARAKKIDKQEIGHFITNAAYVHQDLRNTIKNIPKQVRHNYNLSIANAERSYLLNCIELWQNEVTSLFKSQATVEAILNLVSNHIEPANYGINLQLIANCLHRISKAPIAYDPMLTTLTAEATAGQAYLYQLANSPKDPLHQALWPVVDFTELTKDAPEEYQYQPNKGDGAFSEKTLIAVGELNKITDLG